MLPHFMQRVRFIARAIACTAVAMSLAILVLALLLPLPPLKPYSMMIEDRNGRFLRAFLASDDAWRLETSPEEIPPKLKYILIKKEDRFFYYHPGVNPFSLLRALVQNAVEGRRV